MLDLKEKLSKILFFTVIYSYLKTDSSTCDNYVQKSYKIVWFYNDKRKTLKFSHQTRYSTIFMVLLLSLNSESKITY